MIGAGMPIKTIAIGLLLTASVAPAALAGTNLPALADYPGPGCAKPGDKPILDRKSTRLNSSHRR